MRAAILTKPRKRRRRVRMVNLVVGEGRGGCRGTWRRCLWMMKGAMVRKAGMEG